MPLHFEEFYCGFQEFSSCWNTWSSGSFCGKLWYHTQLPNCGFWKTSSLKKPKYCIGERGRNSLLWSIPVKNTNSLKKNQQPENCICTDARDLKSPPSRFVSKENITSFCTTSLFERPSPIMQVLLKFSVSFINAKQPLPVLTVNQIIYEVQKH